jgi:[protein-PII] uridylyltransferase
MLGLLDVRHLAGDPGLTLRLRTTLLAQWRRDARRRLPELRELGRSRHRRAGELAHLSVPDLKEAEGGLRDATVLKALVATWLVDVPHTDLERSRLALLDVRDALHELTGRATDRIAPEHWDDLAGRLGLPDARTAQVHVREHGRRLVHLSHLTWRRVDGVLAEPVGRRGAPRRPRLEPVAPGVALSAGEVVLDRGARPADDPLLLLRAVVAAAEHDALLAPATAARLAREAAPLPSPWPDAARQLLVRLLAAGPGLRDVWETLEETGALDALLPEWERVRLLPHASVIHRFTVDRHVVETCVEASALIRRVARPDVLLLAALLHDIGKGGRTDHSIAGEPVARSVAERMGLDPAGVELVGLLVRRHLLLAETATGRDVEDPATAALVADAVGSVEALDLLLALTEADARATAPKAWSSWRAGLVRTLGDRVRGALTADSGPAPADPPAPAPAIDAARGGAVTIEVEPVAEGARVTVVAPDRVGLLADVAGALVLQRAPVRSARAWSEAGDGVASAPGVAVQVWEVERPDVDPAVLRQRYDAVLAGGDDVARRLATAGDAPTDALEPAVVVRPEASAHATVLEVRAADRPGLVHVVAAALARLDVAVRSAHVDTLGPQAVDVFYLQEPGAGALPDHRAAAAAHAVRAALSPAG